MGLDEIHTTLVKYCTATLNGYTEYKNSLKKGISPKEGKIVVVRLKMGYPQKIETYHAISLLPTVSMILKMVVGLAM